MRNILLLFPLTIFYVFSFSQQVQPGEGYVQVEGGRIWYKIVGKGKGTPLLLIHGGPGSNSCRTIPGYSVLSDERPVIFYDQLGSGRSDRPTDTLLWKTDRFAEEVVALRKALGLTEIHIYTRTFMGRDCAGRIYVDQEPKRCTVCYIRRSTFKYTQMDRRCQYVASATSSTLAGHHSDL